MYAQTCYFVNFMLSLFVLCISVLHDMEKMVVEGKSSFDEQRLDGNGCQQLSSITTAIKVSFFGYLQVNLETLNYQALVICREI